MTSTQENIERFQSALGQFVIQFSELEFSLLYFCGVIDHPRNENLGIKENLQSTFDQRRKKISLFASSRPLRLCVKFFYPRKLALFLAADSLSR